MAGTLYLVATPIGNLGDITTRALDTLRAVDFIVAEDTRHSRGLLSHFELTKELWSLPAFAEGERAAKILDRVVRGESCALVTDAGTPAVSDPGEALVKEAVERGVRVVPIPGASAAITALCASGLPTGRFHFLGFLPRKGPERAALLDEVAGLRATLILYESPRRVHETLVDLQAALGDRRACVARELTKLHEEFVRDRLSTLIPRYAEAEVLGEVAILVEGRAAEEKRWTEDELKQALEQGLARGEKLKALSTDLAKRAGWTAKDVYRLGLKDK